MRKAILSILIGCLGFIPGWASTTLGPSETMAMTRTDNNVEITPESIPNNTIIAAFYYWYDSTFNTLNIRTPAWPYDYFVVIDNLTTGEVLTRFFGSRGCIYFTGGFGVWRLRLFSAVRNNPGLLFTSCFTLEDGVLVRQ